MSAKNGLITLGHNAAAAIAATAAKLAEMVGDASNSAIEIVTKAKEDWEGGAFAVLFAMQADFGMEAMADFPDPTVLTGDNPAKYETKVQGTDRKQKTKVVDFYAIFFDGTKTGARYIQELEWIKRMRDKNDGRNGIPADFAKTYGSNEMVRSEREAWIKRRRNTAINAYRKAVQLGYQLGKAEELKGVKVVPLYTDKNENAVRNTPEPIQIYVPGKDGAPPSQWDNVSVGSFLRMDIAKASESETPFEALFESLKRDKPTDANGTASDAKPQHIATTDTFHARAMDVLEYLHETVQDKAKLGVLRKAMRHGEGDGVFLTAYGLMETLKDIFAGQADADRYEKLTAETEKAAA